MKLLYESCHTKQRNKFMEAHIFFLSLYSKGFSSKKCVSGKNNFFVHAKLGKALTLFNIENKESKIKQ